MAFQPSQAPEPTIRPSAAAVGSTGGELVTRMASGRPQGAAAAQQAVPDLRQPATRQHRVLSDPDQLQRLCHQLRAQHRCPGRCVLAGLPRSDLLTARGSDALRHLS